MSLPGLHPASFGYHCDGKIYVGGNRINMSSSGPDNRFGVGDLVECHWSFSPTPLVKFYKNRKLLTTIKMSFIDPSHLANGHLVCAAIGFVHGHDVAARVFHPKESTNMSPVASAASPVSSDDGVSPVVHTVCQHPEVTDPTIAKVFVQSDQIIKIVNSLLDEAGSGKIPQKKRDILTQMINEVCVLQQQV